MSSASEFYQELKNAIAQDKIKLPTLPEVALQVKDAVESETSSADQIASIVANDPALAARLLQVSNSPMYRGHSEIDSVKMAVARMGLDMVKNLVVSLAMQQIFQSTSDTLDKKMRQIWEQSVQMAALAHVLAQYQPSLEKEKALLAGLIYNIGALPIIAMAENIPTLANDERRLDRYITAISPAIGVYILKLWSFPGSLMPVPRYSGTLDYNHNGDADYVDLIIASRLQLASGTNTPLAEVDWNTVPAFSKLGLETENQSIEIEGAAEEIEEIEHILISAP